MIKTTLQAISLVLMMGLTLPALASPPAQKEAKTVTSAVKTAPTATTVTEDVTAQVSINNATAQELVAALNGIGSKKAESIVSYREKYGPFSQLDQLKEVPGIGNALVERNLSRIKL